jgi:protein TonB
MDGASSQQALDGRDGEAFAVLEDFLLRFEPEPTASRPQRTRSRRTAVGTSALFSMLLHVGAVLAFIAWRQNELGVLHESTEAISLESIASEVLEQAAPEAVDLRSGAQATAAQQAGALADSALATLTEIKPAESVVVKDVSERLPTTLVHSATPATEETESETVIAGSAETTDAPPPPLDDAREADPPKAEAARKTPKPAPPEKRTPEARPESKPDIADTRQSKKGGAPSRSSAAATPGAGRASASAGDIAGYAARVRARVAGNRPSTRGGRGTTVVSFGVSKSGGLTYVRLGRSSGVSALDQAAVAAVRRSAPFPTPPAGTPAGRLAFSVPFYFK